MDLLLRLVRLFHPQSKSSGLAQDNAQLGTEIPLFSVHLLGHEEAGCRKSLDQGPSEWPSAQFDCPTAKRRQDQTAGGPKAAGNSIEIQVKRVGKEKFKATTIKDLFLRR